MLDLWENKESKDIRLGHSSTTENHSRSENRLKDVGRILEESKKGWSILIRSAPNGSSSQSEPIEQSVWWVGPGDGPKPRQPNAQEQKLYTRGKHKRLVVSSVALHLNWIHNSCGDAWKNAADDASRWHFGGMLWNSASHTSPVHLVARWWAAIPGFCRMGFAVSSLHGNEQCKCGQMINLMRLLHLNCRNHLLDIWNLILYWLAV